MTNGSGRVCAYTCSFVRYNLLWVTLRVFLGVKWGVNRSPEQVFASPPNACSPARTPVRPNKCSPSGGLWRSLRLSSHYFSPTTRPLAAPNKCSPLVARHFSPLIVAPRCSRLTAHGSPLVASHRRPSSPSSPQPIAFSVGSSPCSRRLVVGSAHALALGSSARRRLVVSSASPHSSASPSSPCRP